MRAFILEHLPSGYVETMAWGMICYLIPLARYSGTYNGHPLCYIGLAAQKNNYTIYLTGPYMLGEENDRKFRAAFVAAGKRIDMGKGCLHFKRVDDLALEVLGESIAGVTVDFFIRQYEKVRAMTAAGLKPGKLYKSTAKVTPVAKRASTTAAAKAKKAPARPRAKVAARKPGPAQKSARPKPAASGRRK